MKTMTLVAKHLYFGLDPLRLRDAAERVLSRIPANMTSRATVRLEALLEDLRLGAPASRAVLEQLVQNGVLERLSPSGAEYGITTRFREIARARIIDPLPRHEAQLLVTQCTDLARRFNRTATRNKYEIEIIAVHGSYMSRHEDLSDLMLGITGRRRAPGQRAVMGRATAQTEGTDRIRALFEDRSSFIEVGFFKRLQDVPRPFSVTFKADD
ncbi:MAG: hypothetical protein ABI624_20500 [Casimicrobiaceae bacterium]